MVACCYTLSAHPRTRDLCRPDHCVCRIRCNRRGRAFAALDREGAFESADGLGRWRAGGGARGQGVTGWIRQTDGIGPGSGPSSARTPPTSPRSALLSSGISPQLCQSLRSGTVRCLTGNVILDPKSGFETRPLFVRHPIFKFEVVQTLRCSNTLNLKLPT